MYNYKIKEGAVHYFSTNRNKYLKLNEGQMSELLVCMHFKVPYRGLDNIPMFERPDVEFGCGYDVKTEHGSIWTMSDAEEFSVGMSAIERKKVTDRTIKYLKENIKDKRKYIFNFSDDNIAYVLKSADWHKLLKMYPQIDSDSKTKKIKLRIDIRSNTRRTTAIPFLEENCIEKIYLDKTLIGR